MNFQGLIFADDLGMGRHHKNAMRPAKHRRCDIVPRGGGGARHPGSCRFHNFRKPAGRRAPSKTENYAWKNGNQRADRVNRVFAGIIRRNKKSARHRWLRGNQRFPNTCEIESLAATKNR